VGLPDRSILTAVPLRRGTGRLTLAALIFPLAAGTAPAQMQSESTTVDLAFPDCLKRIGTIEEQMKVKAELVGPSGDFAMARFSTPDGVVVVTCTAGSMYVSRTDYPCTEAQCTSGN